MVCQVKMKKGESIYEMWKIKRKKEKKERKDNEF